MAGASRDERATAFRRPEAEAEPPAVARVFPAH